QQSRQAQGCCPPAMEVTELICLPEPQGDVQHCLLVHKLLISSKARNLINKARISLSIYAAFVPLGLASPTSLTLLNKGPPKSRFVLQHQFSIRLAAHALTFAFAAKRLQA
ncbi:hypothetical protein N311_01535, partial [Apaloderma vittatum]